MNGIEAGLKLPFDVEPAFQRDSRHIILDNCRVESNTEMKTGKRGE
jgi:hypothetical protein